MFEAEPDIRAFPEKESMSNVSMSWASIVEAIAVVSMHAAVAAMTSRISVRNITGLLKMDEASEIERARSLSTRHLVHALFYLGLEHEICPNNGSRCGLIARRDPSVI